MQASLIETTDKMLSRRDGRVGTIVFNNPERHNAVSLEMWEAGARMLEEFAADDGIGVVVLTGAGGKSFVSGADISKFESERATEEAVARYGVMVEKLYADIHNFPKPTIAMIRGYCIGGGLGLALSCDLRICTERSRFALPAAKLGLGYGYPGLKRFVDTIGPAFTKELFFTARQFNAEEAREMGLVNRIVSDNEIEAYVKDYADCIASNAPLTVRATKYIVGQVLEEDAKRNLERSNDLVKQCFASRDYAEGRKAFLEKRKPVFTGT